MNFQLATKKFKLFKVSWYNYLYYDKLERHYLKYVIIYSGPVSVCIYKSNS